MPKNSSRKSSVIFWNAAKSAFRRLSPSGSVLELTGRPGGWPSIIGLREGSGFLSPYSIKISGILLKKETGYVSISPQTVSPTPIAADGECHHLVFIASDDLSGPHTKILFMRSCTTQKKDPKSVLPADNSQQIFDQITWRVLIDDCAKFVLDCGQKLGSIWNVSVQCKVGKWLKIKKSRKIGIGSLCRLRPFKASVLLLLVKSKSAI